jgi:Beta-lactamase superfamily domain
MLLQPAKRDGRRYMNPVPTKVGGLSVMFKVGPRFFWDAAARSPRGTLGPFHTDPRIYAVPPKSGLRITWIGHASSIVEIDGIRILIDPVWDERAAPTTWIGPKRFLPAPLELRDLPLLDIILVSHDHYDHLGAGTIRALAKHAAAERAQWITPLGVGALLKDLGVPPAQCVELNWMDTIQVGAIHVKALPARHFSGRSLSIASKRSGRHLHSSGLNTVCTMEPILESGTASARSGSNLGRSMRPCSRLGLPIRYGRRFTWDRKAPCAVSMLWAAKVC